MKTNEYLSKLLKWCFLLLFPISSFAQDGTWTRKKDFPGNPKTLPVSFSIGNKGYLGSGTNNLGKPYTDWWEYNSATDTWTQKADYPEKEINKHVAGFAIEGKGYVGTGEAIDQTLTEKIYEFNPSTNKWTRKADLPGGGRIHAVAFSIGKKGYLGLGRVKGEILYDFWEYNPSTDSWTRKADFPNKEHSVHTALAINSKGYVFDGNDKFYDYNPSNDSWNEKSSPDLDGGYPSAVFSLNNKGYFMVSNSKKLFEYNPTLDNWENATQFEGSTSSNYSGFSINNKGYVYVENTHEFWQFSFCDQNPTANFTYEKDKLTVKFTSTSENADTFLWDFGDGNTSASKNPEHTYSSYGEYIVKLLAKGECGEDETTQAINLNCNKPDPNFSISINDLIVTFTNKTEGGTSFQWNFGDGNTSTVKDPTHTYSSLGEYTVTLTASNECGSNTKIKEINLSCPSPDAVFDYQADNLNVSFSNSSDRATSFKWNFGDGNTSEETNPSHTYGSSGTYTVELIAFNDCGADTTRRTVDVSMRTGLSEVSDTFGGLKIYPNPAGNSVMIELPTEITIGYSLKIYSIDGREVRNYALTGEKMINADLNGLTAGIYLCVVESNSAIKAREKLIIK
jgi:PKD repeat protein